MPAAYPATALRRAREAILLLSLTLPLAAAAQQWNARDIAAVTNAQDQINLKDGATIVTTVKPSSVATAIRVVDKMAPLFSVDPMIVVTVGPSPNAFATRTDKGYALVGINVSMIKLTEGNPHLLAVVIGHELAHLKLRHVEEGQATREGITALAELLATAANRKVTKNGGDPSKAVAAVKVGGDLLAKKFSRDDERAADDLGLRMMARSGFDPAAAPALWKRMAIATGGADPGWFGTHPSSAERIETLTALAQELAASAPKQAVANATPAPARAPSQTAASTPTPTTTAAETKGIAGTDAWCTLAYDGATCHYATYEDCARSRLPCRTRALLMQADSSGVTEKGGTPVKATRREPEFADFTVQPVQGSRTNFAGHYALTAASCGTGCRTYQLVDTLNGKGFRVPFSGEQKSPAGDTFTTFIETRADSDLLIAVFKVNKVAGGLACYKQFLRWEGEQLRPLGPGSPTVHPYCG